MKKILSLLTLFIFFIACDDGDLTIETIDFNSIDLDNCTKVSPTQKNVLFKINTDQALILELPMLAIANKEDTVELSLSSDNAKIIYRIFSDNVTREYFCNDIPLTEPIVLEEIIAEAGIIVITSKLNTNNTTYTHSIELKNISLVTSDNVRITDLSIDDFGEVTTSVETLSKSIL